MTLNFLRTCLLLQSVIFVSPLSATEIHFLRDVAPILNQRCSGCHGPGRSDGDLRLHTFDLLMKAGASEAHTVVAGKPEESEIFRRITEVDDSIRMPQKDEPLSAAQAEIIRQWILQGAKFDGEDRQRSFRSQLPPAEHPVAPEVYRVPIPIFAVAWSPDGSELAVGGFHEVLIRSTTDGRLLRRLQRLPQRIQAMRYSADGRRLFVAGGTSGDYGELTALDPTGGDQRQVLATFEDIVLGLSLSHAGDRLAATSADRTVRCFHVSDGRMLWTSRLHSDFVTSVAFSHDDRFVATGSKDFTVKVLNANDGSLFTTYNGHQRQFGSESGRFNIAAIAFSEDSRLAFSAGKGRSIRVWEPEKAQQENGSAADMEERFSNNGHTRYFPHESRHGIVQLRVTGQRLFACMGEGIVKEYNVLDQSHVRDYTAGHERCFAMDIHAGSERLAAGTIQGTVIQWETRTGNQLLQFPGLPILPSQP